MKYSYGYPWWRHLWCALRGHSRTRYLRYGVEWCNRCNHPIKRRKK